MAKDIGIDLGTANVLIYVQGKGIVLNEPSVVAIDTQTNKVLAVGSEAYRMVGRTPSNIRAIRPLKNGVISDFDVTQEMLSYFIGKLSVKGFVSKPNIMICAPTNITEIERKAIIQAAEQSGGGKVYLEYEPKVAAIGAGLDIYKPSGNMVIDMGGGTCDIAVLSLGDIVSSQSIRLAGDQMNQDIAAYIKDHHGLVVGNIPLKRLRLNWARRCKSKNQRRCQSGGVMWPQECPSKWKLIKTKLKQFCMTPYNKLSGRQFRC